MSDVSEWWNVGDAPGVTEWCEKNVNDACQALADETWICFEQTASADDISIIAYSTFWECEVGKGTTIKEVLSTFAEDWSTPAVFAERNSVPVTIGQNAAETLRSVRAHIDQLLASRGA
jgi:hypothetical protein